ncbi:phosphoenolpyruvate--protein phosphotransferase [Crenobacter cavernae]|uniref:Phosphoenolpyruvate-protein phosphotransferase n=1 Tax=Crenobacter cavernae TaxID=2290923 RepID=A0A345Y5S0_9NEIS|nr:phosphoenolpyruvate--protein phosphotransferase [Crenobacter cavernae]AXK39272.1 phosphoenolpyruvate--protein phosphotransferase [Crenobacter cavernae]
MSIALHGVPIGGGIAIGRAHLISQSMDEVVHYQLVESELAEELARFDEAIATTREELERLTASVPDNAPAEMKAFLSLHVMLLSDPMLTEEPRGIIESQRCNAEWALKQQADALVEQFDAIEETYLRERKHDVLQVVERVFKNLNGQGVELPDGDWDGELILVAHDLSPADMVLFKDSAFSAFITDVGGSTSHTAILGRSLDLPSVIALHNARELIHEEEWIIVDGEQGVVMIDPDPLVLDDYRSRQERWRAARADLACLRLSPAETLDGEFIELLANIEVPSDIEDVIDASADGVGLFRSEFLFLGRDTLPSEDEQFQAYRKVVSAMQGKPVTIRTMDLGADKNARWMSHGVADNPALGLTGIRLCLAEPLLFRAQLRALMRASVYGKLRILFPMVSGLSELKQALSQLEIVKDELWEEGFAIAENVEVGAMVEVPAAALVVGSFLKLVDFVSIGTNDLIQYTLAVDRSDDAVSHLYDPLHPAVLKLVAHTIKTANKAGIPVSVCGEMAGDLRMTRLLLGMGLTRFSMHPAQVLAVKQIVRGTRLETVKELVARMLRTEDPDKIADLLTQLNTAPGV